MNNLELIDQNFLPNSSYPNALFITGILVKNFRCFDELLVTISSPIVIISGSNGVGKTSLLEAFHYVCYLKSFRTHTPRELIHFENDGFFIKIKFNNQLLDMPLNNELQVGFSGKKRVVKINQKVVSSYKELMNYYRIVTLMEDDLELIKGGPERRRLFIDQALMLNSSEFVKLSKEYKNILDNRNALLQSGAHKGNFDKESYKIWTEQLLVKSQAIQDARRELLSEFQKSVNFLLDAMLKLSLSIELTYFSKYDSGFINDRLLYDELRMGRSLIGAHLDDIVINYADKRSKSYASRGQQKLIIVLLKIAQVQQLIAQKGAVVFLLDDFMTDFDEERAGLLLGTLCQLNTQLIFTTPNKSGFLVDFLATYGSQKIDLVSKKA